MPKLAELRKNLVADGPRIAPEDFLVLAAHVAHVSESVLLAHPDYDFTNEKTAALFAAAKRRAAHEPIAYLIGSKEFYGERFRVNRHVLIPRPETEILVEEALSVAARVLSREPALNCIDLGTGSGAVIVTLARVLGKRFPERALRFIGSDLSTEALTVAAENAERLVPDIPIRFCHGSLTAVPAVKEILSENIPVLITANLPYLSEALYAASMPDVRNFEPREALVSGPDGLDHYRALFRELHEARAPIFLFLEISPEQEAALQTLGREHFPQSRIRILRDLSGLPRVCCLEPKISR